MRKCISMLVAALFAISPILFPSCSGSDNSEVSPQEKGVYKVEVSITGDMEGFVPIITAQAKYEDSNPQKAISTSSGEMISFTDGFFGYNYDENPEEFSKAITFSTTNQAIGLEVGVYPHKSNVGNVSTTHWITITAKGYFNGKLIKSETKKVSNAYSLTFTNYLSYQMLLGKQ